MIAVERNASGVDEPYLDGLAACFPGAWSAASYRWYLKRPFRSRDPETFTAHEGAKIVSGLGLNYRRLTSAGRVFDVGILTAAWTLPTHRRRGCYSLLLDAAVRVATDNGCVALLAFTTATNPSGAALRRIGAYEVPTRYLFLAPDDGRGALPSRPAVQERASVAPVLPSAPAGIAFHYETVDEWAEQFVHRPERTAALETGGRVAIVEHVGSTLRLQYLSEDDADGSAVASLASYTCKRGQYFFHFTTDLALAERAARNGLVQTPGRMLVLDLRHTAAAWRDSAWNVQPGDRL